MTTRPNPSTRTELIALANRWPWLEAPALELPGGRVELGALRPIEARLGVRSTIGGEQIPLSHGVPWPGMVRQGRAGLGMVGSGEARQGMGSAFGRGNSLPSDDLGDDEDTLVDAAPPWGSL